MRDSALLEEVLEEASHLLPAQGPISVFIHHNTLHAFEHLVFEEAVVAAGRLFGCEPFLAEERYREELRRGRILPADLEAILDEESCTGLRREVRLAMLLHEIQEERGPALSWLLAETSAVSRFESLWERCREVSRSVPPPAAGPGAPVRHRDLLLELTGRDTDHLVHPLLIRLAGAFLDQGIAYWPMPGREEGFHRAVSGLARGRWGFSREEGGSARDSVLQSLERLGVERSEWKPFVTQTLLALRGFAGMMRQVETRPDRVPVHAPRASLLDFLAVRLVLERDAVERTAREELGYEGDLRELRSLLRERIPAPRALTAEERAYPLFQLARALSLSEISPERGWELLAEIEAFPAISRRLLFHRAYERRHRVPILEALSRHVPGPEGEPSFQAVFCLDEREESLRRHLEEVEPRCETFGTAGFFGVAMYFRGAEDAHARPLCPIAITPRHEVVEIAEPPPGRKRIRRILGLAVHEARVASRTFTRGTLLTALAGAASAVPLAFRVLAPRLTARLRTRIGRLLREPRSRLALERDPHREPSVGTFSGFSPEEMAAIVERVLTETGLGTRLSPIVLVLGHGSSSLNNPHESAHDCGACGGGRGGPNARAFAQMANHPEARRILRDRGLELPHRTWFVGGYHNSCDDAVTLYDLDGAPPALRGRLAAIEIALDRARARNAHERCRRYEGLAPDLSLAAALAHVEARSEDLAQPRPEYGHATNAVCIVGRRHRTRGLFLDRRAFLVSYHPESDDAAGTLLARILAAAVPVVAGISLEYYFSYVDPVGYGCGTKLPHNVTALLGVMDGQESDLRTGLPWQMVEIHEPVRLLVVIETTPDILEGILAANESLAVLARNRWIQLATLSPSGREVHLQTRAGFEKQVPAAFELPRASTSREWYQGHREHLSPARILHA